MTTCTARHRTGSLLAVLVLLMGSSCASLKVGKTTESSGTFRSSAWSFTIIGIDIPSHALTVARGNAADTGRPNLIVEEEFVTPHFGRLDFLLEIISVRYARVTGTWGDADD